MAINLDLYTNPLGVEWLQKDPWRAYFGFLPRGQPQSFLDYWLKNFSKVYGQWVGREAQRGLLGQAPGEPGFSWEDFMAGFPFQQEYAKAPPWERGVSSIPPLRWDVPW